MTERRQISDAEKRVVLDQHGRRCFVDGAPVPEDEAIEFHHIRPYSQQGATSIDNIAPVCRTHHRSIGTMSLQEYRDKLELDRFFESGDLRYLDDLIRAKHGRYGEPIRFELENGQITLYLAKGRFSYPLYRCPITQWQYFYAIVPVEFLENDRELQPRALRQQSLWELYRHFQTNTQLAPSICRIDDKRLLLFDGQHKAAAQIWSGRQELECKVYIDPDARVLKETNLEAHGKFRQMPFYSHELMRKYADIFGEDWEHYMNETEGQKSEAGFFSYLINTKKKSKPQARNEILEAIYNEIVDNPDNKLSAFLSEKNRSTNQPLTFARLKKTMLSTMLLLPPVEDEFETDTDYRKVERRNLIKLMNIIAEQGLSDKWNPDRNDSLHRRTQRIFSAGAVRAWTTLLRDAINQHLHHYTEDERQRFFYRPIDDQEFKYFERFVSKLFSHKVWDDPDPTGEIAARLAKDDATTAKSLFDERGLTVHWLLGA
jgi:hypothetical protein